MTESTVCDVLFRPASDALQFLPEGPYQIDESRFSWVGIQHGADSVVGSLNIFDLNAGTNQSFDLPGRPGFAFPTNQEGIFVTGIERSVGLFDTQTGTFTALATDIDHQVENTIINDGMVFGDGLIFGCKELEFKTKKAGLYWMAADGTTKQLRNDQICSNGKAALNDDPESLKLIDIDSPSKQIVQIEINLSTGEVKNETVIVDLTSEDVFPDGLIVTPDGKSLIVALYDPADPVAGQARQYGIESGTLEHTWTCPGSPRVTCPQLIQHNGVVSLLLTTAVEHMEADQQARHPNAGCLLIGNTNFDAPSQQPKFPLNKFPLK